MGPVDVVLTDFERTLVRLFEDRVVEEKFFEEVWSHYNYAERGLLTSERGLPSSVREAARGSPYSLWTKAHRWMIKEHRHPIHAEGTYHAVSKIATKYEMDVAESVKLFDDVQEILERWKTAKVPIIIVSNNATAAVDRVLRNNDARHLVDHVIGREYTFEMVGNLKPKPLLLKKGLELSRRRADTALLVGDSVDDMKAGRAAKIRYRVGLLQHSTASRWQLRRAGAKLILNRFGDLQELLPGGGAAADG